MAGGKRAYTENMHVVLHCLTGGFSRRLEERAHVHIETAVSITGCYHLGSAVVTVLTHLGYHDSRLTTFTLGKFSRHFPCFLEIGIVLGFV